MSPTDQVSATFYALRLVRHNNPILKLLLSATEDSNVVSSKDKDYPPELIEAVSIIREVRQERDMVAERPFGEDPDGLQRALSEKVMQLAMQDISIEDYDADAGERILFHLRQQDQNAYGVPAAGGEAWAGVFEVGDKVVYGEYGLGTVEAKTRSQGEEESSSRHLSVPGETRDTTPVFHYLILLDEGEGTISVSSLSASREGLRRPWSPQDCQNFLEELRRDFYFESDPAYICSFLAQATTSGDVVRVSSVLKEFYFIARFSKIARYESSFLNRSMERIAQEVAFGLSLPKAEAVGLLESALNESTQRKHDKIVEEHMTAQKDSERRKSEMEELERLELKRLDEEKLKSERRRKQM